MIASQGSDVALSVWPLVAPAMPWLVAGAIAAALLSWVILPYLRTQMDAGPFDGLLKVVARWWLQLVHRPQWLGWEAVHALPADRGLIVVSNHASGVDPFLIQMPLWRRVRWLMAQDQMVPVLKALWTHLEILPVTYSREDAAVLREAIRHVERGGVLGIFPEGGIAQPPREVRAFLGGIGLVVSRARAPVVLVWIEGAPEAPSALASLVRPSRCRVHCLGVLDYSGSRDTDAIVRDLRARLVAASGWRDNDTAVVPVGESPAEAARAAPVPSDR